MLLARGVIRESIDIAQLIGGAQASGGTHTAGGAFDVWQHDPVTQEIGREMGAATWNRVAPHWSGSKHSHGVLNGCPHNWPARYQIDALADGYSGLGKGGRGSRDYGPGPRQLRTWREGIAWANKQLEDDMPLTDEDLDKIAYRVWAKEIGGGDNRKAARLHVIQAANASLRNEANKVDPKVLAAAIVAALPTGRIDEATVVAGVKRALREMVDEEHDADPKAP